MLRREQHGPAQLYQAQAAVAVDSQPVFLACDALHVVVYCYAFAHELTLGSTTQVAYFRRGLDALLGMVGRLRYHVGLATIPLALGLIVGLPPWEVLSLAPGRVALSEGHAYDSTSGDVGTSIHVLSYLSLPAVLRRSASPRLFGAGHLARNPDRSVR